MLKLADAILILINPSPSNVNYLSVNVLCTWYLYDFLADAFIILAKEIASSSGWHLAHHSICILLHYYLKWNCTRNCEIGQGLKWAYTRNALLKVN